MSSRAGKFVLGLRDQFVNYVKMLAHDYKSVAVDTVNDARERKLRTALIASAIGFGYYCFKTNPSELDYETMLIRDRLRLSTVGSGILNPYSQASISERTGLWNRKQLRHFNCMFFSLVIREEFPASLALYEAQCKHVQAPWLDFPKRIEDVGFLGRWWLAEKKMLDYDINPHEWEQEH